MSTNEPQQPNSRSPNGTRFPDPSILTTEQLLRAIESEREWTEGQLDVLRERLLGIDRATELRFVADRGGADLRSHQIQEIPNQIAQAVEHLATIMGEKFDSIELQFKERDTRSERESRDNKVAVDAAFAAQKEAAAKQDEANSKAIDKSEKATQDTIVKLSELFSTTTRALGDKIDDLKERASRTESIKQGAAEFQSQARAGISSTTGIIGAVIAVILVVLALVGYQASRSRMTPAAPTPTPTVTVTTPPSTP